MENKNNTIVEERTKIAMSRAEAKVRENALKEGRVATEEEIEVAVLRAKANVIAEELRRSVTKTPAKEEEAPEEVTKTPAKEEEAPEEVAETPAKEEEAPEEVVETPVKEEEAPKEAAETPAKAEKTTVQDDDWMDEFLDGLPEKTTNLDQKKKVSDEEADSFGTFEEEETTAPKDRKSIWIVILGIAVVICLIVILAMAFTSNKVENSDDDDDFNKDFIVEGDLETTDDSSQEKTDFDLSEFNAMCVNLAKHRTDEEDIVGDVYKSTENIGAKKLVELTKKYGETDVANTIVNIVVGGSEAMRDDKIAKEGWQYNPNATDEYYNTYIDICKAYESKLGKNPTVVLESIAAYKANPGNRIAIEEEIRTTGDLDLLKWYQDNAKASDLLTKQSKDTQLADQYKEKIENELIESEAFVKILEKVLEKQSKSELVVIENNECTKAFKDYIVIEIAAVVDTTV